MVMIGRFKTIEDSRAAKEAIDKLVEAVCADDTLEEYKSRYGGPMLHVLSNLNIHSVAPHELEQFRYDVSVKIEDETITIHTDEVDVAAFLKVMFDKGARIEVYSAHDYPDTATSEPES